LYEGENENEKQVVIGFLISFQSSGSFVEMG
jgi:hypothetical protein